MTTMIDIWQEPRNGNMTIKETKHERKKIDQNRLTL